MNQRTHRPYCFYLLAITAFLLTTQQVATAQTLLIPTVVAPTLIAQTGTTKTLIGWAIVLLCIGLGLLVICRPSIRNPPQKKYAAKK